MKKEINPYARSTLANCMAFHDFKFNNINIKELFKYIVELFYEYDLEPTRLGFSTLSKQSKSMKTYVREHKKLLSLSDNEIKSFTLQATSNNSDDSCYDSLFTAHFSKRDLGDFSLIFDKQFFSFDYQKIKNIYQKIIEFLSPNYGYFYQREFKKGSEFYPYGILYGISSLESMKDYSPEANLITQWGHKLNPDHSQAYKTGDLRDVYPMNLLVDIHLTRAVFPNTSFEQFIQSDERHGILENIADGHYTWLVDDMHIPRVREALRPSSMIIAG